MRTIPKAMLLSLVMPMWIAISMSANAADVICYNCPPEWADWASMLRAIKADLGYDIPFDNKNSGQTLSQLIAEKNNPVADLAYYGVNFAIKAKAAGVHDPYKPKGWDEVPTGLKDPEGYWTTIHSGTLGLFVNKDALGGKPVPALEGSSQAGLSRHGRLSRPLLGGGRLCGRGCGQPLARRLSH
jgi:putative spermidine/putrescine transport system substrate-binding protein